MAITFRDALSILSKSSPYSVKTLSTRPPDEYDALKRWLYIEQDIEKDLGAQLECAQAGDIVFLCGSSGDGKSEILTRVHDQYRDRMDFHLDATHSFSPNQSAIDALDHTFSVARTARRVLVVGINIGMIGNYALEGHENSWDVREAMRRFLDGQPRSGRYFFFNFEDYPKFKMEGGVPVAPFAKQIMQRITDASAANPFYALFRQGSLAQTDPILYANFRLLMLTGVQDAIIANIAKARLVNDQFVTARGLLDLLYGLLTGRGYLFDNLFAGGDNELAARFVAFDPALLRTRELDQLLLRYELGLPEPALDMFIDALKEWRIHLEREQGSASSLIRLFYVLQSEEFANNYHATFAPEFIDAMLVHYAHVWQLHAAFDDSVQSRAVIRKFYIAVLIPGIFRFANRNAAELGKGEILLGVFNGVKIAGLAELKPDFARLEALAPTTTIAAFNVALRVGDVTLKTMLFNINLFSLLVRLNQGYRPNKHDKNAVVLLDELVEQIKTIVKRGNRLRLYGTNRNISLRHEDGMIDIVGAL